MKQWPDDHPKGKLLARKRAAILDAAQDAFLNLGYEGASMESIAAAAGVSIMTLYRHARRKEDLFAAIIENACDHSGPDEQAMLDEMMRMELDAVLVKLGVLFQASLAKPQIVALLRVVITEAKRFPSLADLVYQAFFFKWETNLDAFLARKELLGGVDSKLRRKACAAFFSQLVGTETLRVVMGLKGATANERTERARVAASAFVATITTR